jgi:Ca2+-binding EF-hand superfamily protein
MNHFRLFPLLCSATLFMTGRARAEDSAPSAIGQEIFGPALAPPLHHEHALTPQEQELLAKFDKNGDGRLAGAELDAAHGAAQQQKAGREVMARQMYDSLLAKFDTAKDGKLNPEQQKQALNFLKTERPRLYAIFVKQFDRNGDGELNQAETAAVFQYLSYLPSGLGKVAPKAAMDGSANAMGGDSMAMGAGGGEMMDGAAAAPMAEKAASAKAGNANAGGTQMAKMYARLLKGFDHEGKGSLNPAEQAEALDYIETNNPDAYERMVKRFDANRDGKLDAAETAKMFAVLAKAGQMAKQPE